MCLYYSLLVQYVVMMEQKELTFEDNKILMLGFYKTCAIFPLVLC